MRGSWQASQGQGGADAPLMFTVMGSGAAQVFPFPHTVPRVGGVSEFPSATSGSPSLGPAHLWPRAPGANHALASAETLGVLVRAVGEPMRPLVEECCQLGLGLCDQVDDPDLRRCT